MKIEKFKTWILNWNKLCEVRKRNYVNKIKEYRK